MNVLFLKSAMAPMVLTLATINEQHQIVIVDEMLQDDIRLGQPSQELLKGIELLIERNNLAFTDIAQVYVASGPGSYTGTRLLVTIVKTLAFLCPNIMVFDASLLDIYERMNQISRTNNNYGQDTLDKQSLALVYARRNKYYISGYLDNQEVAPQVIAVSNLLALLKKQPCLINGDYFAAGITDVAEVAVALDYTAWQEVSTVVADIMLYEPYYLEAVTIG